MPGETGDLIEQGDIYWVDDDLISFPEERRSGRTTPHPRRPVVVLSGIYPNSLPSYPFVLVAPLASERDPRRRWDPKCQPGQDNIRSEGWIRLSLLQPVLKEDLQEKCGKLGSQTLLRVLGQLAMLFGVILDQAAATSEKKT